MRGARVCVTGGAPAAAIFSVLWFALAVHAEDKKPDTPKITYDEQVVAIFRDKCFGCHNPDKKSGGLILTNYTTLMAGGGSGEVIEPGDANASTLYLLVTHRQEPHMPPKSEMLPKESLETIRQWIAGGALENSGSKARVSNKPKLDITLKAAPTTRPDGPPPMPQSMSLEPVLRTRRADAISALAASPWAPLVAVAGQRQVLLYHSDTLEPLGVLPFPEGVPRTLRFSRNGALVLAAGGRGAKSGRAVVWSVTTGERVIEAGDEFDSVLAADISADQTQVALGGPSKAVRIFSTRDGQLLFDIKKHTDWVTALEYSPDGVLLATGDRNGGLFVWESYTGREFFSLRGHTAAITSLSWRADSNILASASEDGTIRLWEMENGNQVKNWGAHGGGVESIHFARDGRIASCGRDRIAKVWDQNGAQQRAFEAMPELALRVAFSHDASRVICGDWTGQVRVWSAADGKPLGDLLANPPTLAERLDAAQKELAARKAAYDPLAAAAAAAQAAAAKAAADLAAAQKSVADTAAAAKAAADAAAKAKDASDKAAAAATAAQADAAAKDQAAKTAAQAAAQAKQAADQAAGNQELADKAAAAKQAADKLAADLAAAQKTAADLAAAAKAALDRHSAAAAAAQKTAAESVAATKAAEALVPLAKAAADKAAADKAAADQAAAALAAAQAAVTKWSAALTTARQSAEQARLNAPAVK